MDNQHGIVLGWQTAVATRQLKPARIIRHILCPLQTGGQANPPVWGGQNFPPDVDEMYFQVTGVIKDVERLKQLFYLFAETLDELCRMGSAYETNPGVSL
jgi:hypothetical protein